MIRRTSVLLRRRAGVSEGMVETRRAPDQTLNTLAEALLRKVRKRERETSLDRISHIFNIGTDARAPAVSGLYGNPITGGSEIERDRETRPVTSKAHPSLFKSRKQINVQINIINLYLGISLHREILAEFICKRRSITA